MATSTQQIIDQWARTDNVDPVVAETIAQEESSGNAYAMGDYQNGAPTSFGLFQLHQGGGQGDGYTQQQLLDANTNAQIGVGNLSDAYKAAKAQGLTGYQLVQYVASHSGHPDSNGALPASYNDQLYAAYQDVTAGKFGSPSGSASNAPAPPGTSSGSGGTYSNGSGIAGTATSIFFGVAGAAVILLGIWILVNPAANFASALIKGGGKA